MSLLERVRRLELGIRKPVTCVVTFALGESPEAALLRAEAAGMSGGVIVVGQILPPGVWCEVAADQQQRLLASVAADMVEV